MSVQRFRRVLADALRLPMFSLSWRLLPGSTVTLELLITAAALVPAASIVSVGFILGAGDGSLESALVAGGAFVLLFFLDQVLNAVIDVVADKHGGRLQASTESALIRSRLQSPTMQANSLPRALAAIDAAPPMRQLAVSTARYVLMRAQALFPGMILLVLQPLTGFVVLMSFVVLSIVMERGYKQEQSAAYATDKASARATYISGLASDRRGARDLINFRAGEWVIEKFRAAARTAQPATRIEPSLLLALFFAAAAMALALVGLYHAQLPPSQMVMAVSSLMALTLLFGVTMDAMYSAMGTDIFHHVELAIAESTSETVLDSEAPCAGLGSTIRFEHVAFSYPGSRSPVFTDLNFEVVFGSSVAIVGINGAGKSTLLKLLAGLLTPTSGRILCDGVDVTTKEALRSWRRSFALLGQQYIRFPTTLRENVTLGGDGTIVERERRVHALLEDLNPELLAPNSQRLATTHGTGDGLSGGQWQRVATSRALAGMFSDGRKVLLLDEPTAALDAEAEARFFARLNELAGPERTTVMVSHRFAGVRQADEILVLHDGVVAERGSHVRLMELDGRYAPMFRAQASRYDGAVPGSVDSVI